MKIKDDFHKLIDKIDDEKLLKSYFKLIQRLNKSQTGDLWDSLTEEEQEELIMSYEESFYPDNLLSHAKVKEQHAKWLKK